MTGFGDFEHDGRIASREHLDGMAPVDGLVCMPLNDLGREVRTRWVGFEPILPLDHGIDPGHRQHVRLQRVFVLKGNELRVVGVAGDCALTGADERPHDVKVEPEQPPAVGAHQRREPMAGTPRGTSRGRFTGQPVFR